MFLYKYMYTLISYCKVHALMINELYTGHISVHMHISHVLGYYYIFPIPNVIILNHYISTVLNQLRP